MIAIFETEENGKTFVPSIESLTTTSESRFQRDVENVCGKT